jgi:hypothetical protein
MTPAILAATDPAARLEGWLWWIALVVGIAVVLLVLAAIRRFLVRPMSHKPSDTSDAWAEAGRRLPPPPPEGKPGAAPPDEDSP